MGASAAVVAGQPDLAVFELLLELPRPARLPLALGDSLLAAAYRVLQTALPEVADQAHALHTTKPFALSPLRSAEGYVLPKEELPAGWYSWRVSGLNAAVAAGWQMVAERAATSGLPLAVGGLRGQLVGGRCLAAWCSRQLVAGWLTAPAEPAALPETWCWDFVTPTWFRGRSADGRNANLVWPQPELLVRSLSRRWQQLGLCPYDLPPDAGRGDDWQLLNWSGESLAVRLQERWQRAFCGRFTWRLPADPAVGGLVGLLATFATVAGVGARTTHGCGVVEASPNSANTAEPRP